MQKLINIFFTVKDYKVTKINLVIIRSLLLSLISVMSFLPNFSNAAQDNKNEDILIRISEGKINTVKFRIRMGTSPINYARNNEFQKKINDIEPEGFCIELARQLEENLNNAYRKSNKKNKIEVKTENYLEVDNPRFDKINKKEFDIQCGADSRRRIDLSNPSKFKNIIFSEPFLSTGTKLVVKKAKLDELGYEPNSSEQDHINKIIENLVIGLTGGTTTTDVFGRYNVTLQNYPSRIKGFEALKSGEIQAFASDDILLQSFIKEQNNSDDYVLFPPYTLSTEDYSVVLHKDNYMLKKYVDTLINNQKKQLEDRLSDENYNFSSEGYKIRKQKNDIEKQKNDIEKLNQKLNEKDLTIRRFIILLIIILSIVCLGLLFLIWRWKRQKNFANLEDIKERQQSFATLEYIEDQQVLEIFLYTLEQFDWIKSIILDFDSDKKLLFKIPLINNKTEDEFRTEFNKNYKNNQGMDEKKLSSDDFISVIKELLKVTKELLKLTEAKGINISVYNEQIDKKHDQTGNFGVGINPGTIEGEAKVTGKTDKGE